MGTVRRPNGTRSCRSRHDGGACLVCRHTVHAVEAAAVGSMTNSPERVISAQPNDRGGRERWGPGHLRIFVFHRFEWRDSAISIFGLLNATGVEQSDGRLITPMRKGR